MLRTCDRAGSASSLDARPNDDEYELMTNAALASATSSYLACGRTRSTRVRLLIGHPEGLTLCVRRHRPLDPVRRSGRRTTG
ncbi:Uncharacterised protein [Mycobacteroides abscessus subsp. abscessus]|nr:Uncharacterised protein [Mycobacteroides abscessus subsp. abscessus]